jgi:hypothetical protein
MDGLFEVIVLSLISALEVVWVLSRFIVPSELAMIFLILVLVVVCVLNLRNRIFWRLMFLIFLVNLLNLGYLFLRFGRGIILYVCLMLTCVGMGIAIMNMYIPQRKRGNRKKVVQLRAKEAIPEPPRYVPEPPEYVAETPRYVIGESKVVKEVKPAVKKEFSPERYVVSKTGKQYHLPRCIWARRINENNQMWFESEKAAEKRGYTRHWCVRK